MEKLKLRTVQCVCEDVGCMIPQQSEPPSDSVSTIPITHRNTEGLRPPLGQHVTSLKDKIQMV